MRTSSVLLVVSALVPLILCAVVSSAGAKSQGYEASPLLSFIQQKLEQENKPSDGIRKIMENSIFRDTLIPFYLRSVCSLDLDRLFDNMRNPVCEGNVRTFLKQICNNPFASENLWALQMADAWAKPPEGLLSGHMNPMGDFDECVQIEAKDLSNVEGSGETSFKGRYCTVYLIPSFGTGEAAASSGNDTSSIQESVSPEELLHLMSIQEGILIYPSIGVCFPNTCEKHEIHPILNNLAQLLSSSPGFNLATAMHQCYDLKKPSLDAADISVIALIGGIAALCIVAAIVDILLHRGVEKPKPLGLGMQYLMAFSMYTNTKKWLSTRSSGDDLGCIHGIRFISTTWVILAHTWYCISMIPMWNMVDVKKIHESWSILTVLNSTISVDTFFMLSGLLVAFNVLKVLDKQKGRLNIPMFYLHRYLRLTPTYAILVGIMATLVPYLGSGPFWELMQRWSNICENNWWTNLLYVNNLVNTSWLCQGEAWYLANDMQFYVLSPLVLYPLWYSPIIGTVFLVFCTICGILTPGLLVYFKKTAPTTIGTRDIQAWFLDVYIKPWARFQTYLVGVWVGYILYKYRGRKIHIPRLLNLAGWLLATGTALAVLYGVHPYFDPEKEIPRVEGFIYASLNRFAWAGCVGWVIFACCKGYGGLINSFLSWKVFMPLGRLCFCVFLVSLHLQMILHLSLKAAFRLENYTMVNYFFAHLVMSFLVGYFCTMFFESPFMKVEKLIFEGADRPKPAPAAEAPAPKERYGIFYNKPETVINGVVDTNKTE